MLKYKSCLKFQKHFDIVWLDRGMSKIIFIQRTLPLHHEELSADCLELNVKSRKVKS